MENARSKPRMMRHEEVDGGGRGVAHQGHPLLSLGQHPLGGKAGNADTNPRFWPVVLETFSERRLQKGKADRTKKRVYQPPSICHYQNPPTKLPFSSARETLAIDKTSSHMYI